MRLAMIHREQRCTPHVGCDTGWIELSALGFDAPSLHAFIERGPAALAALRQSLLAAPPPSAGAGTQQPRFALPIARPGKIICMGLNFRDHAAEGGFEIPRYPALFLRTATSLVAADDAIARPEFSDKLDYEAELLVVIGRRSRHLPVATALDAVWGYSLFNDASVRNWQKHSPTWTMGKNFDRTGAFGPWIVSADAVPAGARGLGIRCRVNGQTLQDSSTDDMIFPVAEALAYISRGMTLEPGDVIAMGTPAGVGFARKPPIYLQPGDVCEVEIDGIGCLRNPVVIEPGGVGA